MCGILALVYEEAGKPAHLKVSIIHNYYTGKRCVLSLVCLTFVQLLSILEPYLRRRGSDVFGFDHDRVAGLLVEGRGYVLSMRGCLTVQPLKNTSTGDWLLWNGEVFGGKLRVSMQWLD